MESQAKAGGDLEHCKASSVGSLACARTRGAGDATGCSGTAAEGASPVPRHQSGVLAVGSVSW